MRIRTFSLVLKRIAASASLIIVALCSSGAAPHSPLLSPPLQGGKPVPVDVGLFINNVISVDESKEMWQLSGELRMEWSDPRLRYHGAPSSLRPYPPDAIWTPRLHISNTFTPRTSAKVDVFVRPDGQVHYSEVFWASVKTELDVHRFPFDTERLPVIFEALGSDVTNTRLIADPVLSGINPSDFTRLAQWKFRRLDSGTQRIDASGFHPAHTAVNFGLVVSRNAQSFFWKFMVPLVAIVFLSWFAFWMPMSEYQTKDQLGISTTTLLTTVAFTLALTTFLPRVSYLTFIDGFVLVCFLWVLCTVVNVYVQTFLRSRGREAQATRLRRVSAFAMPISFVIAQALLFALARPI